MPAKPSPSPAATPTPVPQFVLPDIVATVNGDPIKKADLERFTEMYLNAGGHSIKSYPPAEQKKKYQAMLDTLVVDRLISAQAANEPVDKLDVEKRLAELRSQYPSQAALDADIKKSGQTPEMVEQNIRNQIAREQWMQRQTKDQVIVTPEEIKKYYKDGPPNKFDEPEKVSAYHILIPVRRDAPPEEALAAEKRANAVIDRLKKGEKFEDVAVQVSGDPTVKKNNGFVGTFSREGVMPEFADAAFRLKVGEISGPVRTQFGYHVIKVTDRKPAHTDTLDEAQGRIETYIEGQKQQRAIAQVVQKLRDSAKIDIAPELRADPDAAGTSTTR